MHTEISSTLSDFKLIGTPVETPERPLVISGTLVRMASADVIIFSRRAADGTKESMDQVSLEERMKPKDEFLFAPAIDGRLKVHTPFNVRIVSSGHGVSAHAPEIEEFGYGTNRGEALDDLGKTIAELYFSLAADREKLSQDLHGVLKSLEEHITQVHP
jgi:hypothetical protein